MKFTKYLHNLRRVCTWKAYYYIGPFYRRVFAQQIRPKVDTNSLASRDILALLPELRELSSELNYFIMHASYGDKWCILSYLVEHFSHYPASRVIASSADQGLVELFMGPVMTQARFIFIESDSLNALSSYFRPISKVSMPLADTWFTDGCQHTLTPFFLKHGLPAGTIRHLHVVYYPYFSELMNIHGVSYGVLLKTLLYLPESAQAVQPAFYTDEEYRLAAVIARTSKLGGEDSSVPAILLNAVNFSHQSLNTSHIAAIITNLEAKGFRVLVNGTQHPQLSVFEVLLANHRHAEIISIPPRLLALVYDQVHAVVGVLGGAMNVAVQFSNAHVLSLQTSSVGHGCSDDELLGQWGKEKVWKWIDQDWPCLRPGRHVENRFIGDPSILSHEALLALIDDFMSSLPMPVVTEI